jgi:hypothetical protein
LFFVFVLFFFLILILIPILILILIPFQLLSWTDIFSLNWFNLCDEIIISGYFNISSKVFAWHSFLSYLICSSISFFLIWSSLHVLRFNLNGVHSIAHHQNSSQFNMIHFRSPHELPLSLIQLRYKSMTLSYITKRYETLPPLHNITEHYRTGWSITLHCMWCTKCSRPDLDFLIWSRSREFDDIYTYTYT